MIYSDRDIKKLISDGVITIIPFPDFNIQLGSCSIDLRLGNEFKVFAHQRSVDHVIDPFAGEDMSEVMDEVSVADHSSFILQPHSFVLGLTIEHLELPDHIVARLEGRSSLGRLGIIVHATASIIDPGWRGRIVLELANHGMMPVALRPGMRICALTFEPLSSPVDVPYWMKAKAKYKNQQTPETSKISTDIEMGNS